MADNFFDIVDKDGNPVDKEQATLSDKDTEIKGDAKISDDSSDKVVTESVDDTAIKADDTDEASSKSDDKSGKGKKEPKNPILAEIIDWVKVLVVAGVLAFCINNFIIANSTIPTGSMENTIMPGARVFGSRLKYTFGEVQRDDIAIFVYGYTCKNDGQMYRENNNHTCPVCGRADKDNSVVYYVKRVIGMPGDHIEIRQTGTADASQFHNIQIGANADGTMPEVPVGTVYVNGVAKEEVYLPEPMIVDKKQFPEVDVVVPEGYYYVLGDNRNNSMDARYWGEYNMVARDRMVAKVYVKYWPLSDIGFVK